MKKILSISIVVLLFIFMFSTNSMQVAFQSSPNGLHSKVLWDISHGETSESPISHFSQFRAELEAAGYQIVDLSSGPINYSILTGFDLLVLTTPEVSFSTTEINDIVSFVRNGHGLLYLCAFGYNWRDVANPLVNNFGVTFVTDMVKDPTTNAGYDYMPIIHEMEHHEITNSCLQFVMEEPGTFQLNPPARQVAWGDSDAYCDLYPAGSYPPVVAISEYGQGRAAFIHDTDMFKNWLLGSYDNKRLGLNLIGWLSTPPVITATIDIDPDTLNLKSKGKWITCYIELPESYNVSDIDVSTILLNDTVPAEWSDIQDNVLMVKFNRTAVISLLDVGNQTIKVTGELADGTPFEGTDMIRAIHAKDNYPIVPEFPKWTSMLIILIVLTVATATYKRRLLKMPIH